MGRKKKDVQEKGEHTKFSEDNMMRKIKSNFIDYSHNLINNSFKNKELKFLRFNSEINENLKKDYNLKLMDRTFKDLYENTPISIKYKKLAIENANAKNYYNESNKKEKKENEKIRKFNKLNKKAITNKNIIHFKKNNFQISIIENSKRESIKQIFAKKRENKNYILKLNSEETKEDEQNNNIIKNSKENIVDLNTFSNTELGSKSAELVKKFKNVKKKKISKKNYNLNFNKGDVDGKKMSFIHSSSREKNFSSRTHYKIDEHINEFLFEKLNNKK